MLKKDQLSQTLLTQSQHQDQIKQKAISTRPVIGGSNFFSQIFFTWVMHILSFGSKNTVDVDVMPILIQKYQTNTEFNRLKKAWDSTSRSQKQGRTLIRVIYKAYKRQWMIVFGLVVIGTAFYILRPYLTSINISYIKYDNEDTNKGIVLFLSTFVVTVLYQIVFAYWVYRLSLLGITLSNGLTMMIFDKSLKFSFAMKDFNEGQIINFSQVDAQRLKQIGYHLAALFYGPVQIVFGIIILYQFVGISCLATIVIMILVLILSYFISSLSVKINQKLLKAKDQRMKVTEQMFDIIRFIKINALQKYFFNKVDEKRQVQIKLYLRNAIVTILSVFLYWFTCPLIICMTFLMYTLLGNQMTAQVGFTCLVVVGLFEYPMYSMPAAVTEIAQLFTSLKRIQKYLMCKQINRQNISNKVSHSSVAIQIKNGNFFWQLEKKDKKQKQQKDQENKENKMKDLPVLKSQQQIEEIKQIYINTKQQINFNQKNEEGKYKYSRSLKDINLNIRKGTFTMVLGDIGSGKSSLLLAILNEMLFSDEVKINISGEPAYVSQKPWIMPTTIKDNITFTSAYDQKKFRKVIACSALESDLKLFPKGQLTQIGQKGINISGGQKTRVGLARALYSDKQIYLLDDILSAVDVHVGQFIMKQAIKGYLRGRTIIMPTHAIKFAFQADNIIIMKKGRIIRQGRFQQVSLTDQFKQLTVKQSQNKKQSKSDEEQQKKLQQQMQLLKQAMHSKSKTQSEQKLEQYATDKIVETLMLDQEHAAGKVDFKIFKEYIKFNGGYFKFVVLVVFAMFLWIALKTLATVVLQRWCQSPQDNNIELYIFIALSLGSNLFVFIRSFVIRTSNAIQGKIVHQGMIKSLIYASLTEFFNRIPIGRIINRLTKDLQELDQQLVSALNGTLINLFQLIGVLGICLYASTVYSLIPMVIVTGLAMLIRNYYLKTQREVARLAKSTNSPVVSGFMSSISGIQTIRAFNKSVQFNKHQLGLFDKNKRVVMTKLGLQNWFAEVLAYISSLVNMPCIAYCLFFAKDNPSMVGLLMVYALTLSDSVIGFILTSAEFETKIVSLQRIYSFMNIAPQHQYKDYLKNWSPVQEGTKQVIPEGQIQFKNLAAKYRKDLPNVLKGLSCKIEKGQKIGIVGRTGAGKTTLINTLLGITNIVEGQILIDGVSLNQYSIKDLRHSITMIDQQPTLIRSTFKQNLDITHMYSDKQLNDILQQCGLAQIIKQKGGLDAAVSNSSLSAGQKQLLCICRGFLKKSKLILIDQATANIDTKNDFLIQKVIAQKFKQNTVLTIAHRLTTLQKSDKIMVMQEGRLIQFGSPEELVRKQGVYAQMLRKNVKQMLG